MNYFLGFFLNDQSRKQIVDSMNNISTIFSDMDIQVRWIKPSHYHLKIQNLSDNVGPIKKFYISRKIREVFDKEIEISVGDLKLGSSRNLRGLLYAEIDKGGDVLRELRYETLKNLKIKDNVQFIPHIAVGRINKDLSNQEVSNIIRNIRNINKKSGKNNEVFNVRELDLIRVKDGNYEILKKFVTEV